MADRDERIRAKLAARKAKLDRKPTRKVAMVSNSPEVGLTPLGDEIEGAGA